MPDFQEGQTLPVSEELLADIPLEGEEETTDGEVEETEDVGQEVGDEEADETEDEEVGDPDEPLDDEEDDEDTGEEEDDDDDDEEL